jgi:hypothetical protein
MAFRFGANGVNYWSFPEGYFDLVPVFCDECSRPVGRIALGLLQRMYGAMLCSDACRVMAEWHAPERR